MNEGRGTRTIPLRRARNGNHAAPVRTAGWQEMVTEQLRLLSGPPRLLWLATLGGTAITLRSAQALWTRMVSEGESAERWLRRGAPDVPQARP